MWGSVTIDGITFREELSVAETGAGEVTIRGQDSYPPQTQEAVLAAHRSVLGLRGRDCAPVVFSDKTGLTGFYRVSGASSTLLQFAGGSVMSATWELTLVRLGNSADVEFESVVPTIARASQVSGTASFWQAPPVGTLDYYTGSTVPAGSVARVGAEGTVVAYRGIPTDVTPRWTVPTENYMAGSVRILFDGYRQAGLTTPAHATWELSNGLVRVASAASPQGPMTVECWDSGAWRSTRHLAIWTPVTDYLTAAPEVTVLRADPEECVLRLTWPTTPGRIALDLSLRRGSRFVTGVIKRHSATSLAVESQDSAASAAVTGGDRETAADANGNRLVIGSSRTVIAGTTRTRVQVDAVARLDFFAGHEIGPSPGIGDAFADLFAQYLAAGGERVRALRR